MGMGMGLYSHLLQGASVVRLLVGVARIAWSLSEMYWIPSGLTPFPLVHLTVPQIRGRIMDHRRANDFVMESRV